MRSTIKLSTISSEMRDRVRVETGRLVTGRAGISLDLDVFLGREVHNKPGF